MSERVQRSRRMYALAAGSAMLAGLGLSWWRLRDGASAPTEAENAFWAMTLQDPAGKSLAMADLKGHPLLVNFWATWCPPCVEEMPLLSDFYEQNKANSWQVLGIAVDQVASVQRFLTQLPVSFPVVMGGGGGLSISQSLGNRQGGLPFSVLFNAQGKVVRHTIGRLSAKDLAAWKQVV